MVQSGDTIPQIADIAFLILKILGLFAVLLVGAVLIVPRILHRAFGALSARPENGSNPDKTLQLRSSSQFVTAPSQAVPRH